MAITLLILAGLVWVIYLTVKLRKISTQLGEIGQNLNGLRTQDTLRHEASAQTARHAAPHTPTGARVFKESAEADGYGPDAFGPENISGPTPAETIPEPRQPYGYAAKSAATGPAAVPDSLSVTPEPLPAAAPSVSSTVPPDQPAASTAAPTDGPDTVQAAPSDIEPLTDGASAVPEDAAENLEPEADGSTAGTSGAPAEIVADAAPAAELPVDSRTGAPVSPQDDYFDDFEEGGKTRDGLVEHVYKFVREGNIWVAGGVLMLLLGFAFLLTYMAERGIFSIEMRIACAAGTGLAMVGLGLFLRARRPSYALIMQGGGLGVMYLAVFAAAKLTALFSAPMALGLMTLLIIPGVALAVLQNAQVLALFAFLGGFAAPVLLSEGSGNYVALFSYYTLLGLGLLGITRYKLWRWLNLMGGFCTFAVLGYWCFASYNLTQFLSLTPFLAGFTLIYTLITLISAHKRTFSFKITADAALACAIPFAAAFLQWRMAAGIPHGLSLSALGYGAFYLLLAVFIWKRWAFATSGPVAAATGADAVINPAGFDEPGDPAGTAAASGRNSAMQRLAELYLVCGAMLVNLAVPLEFSEEITSAVWALEGAVLYYMAVRTGSARIKLAALILLLVGVAACALDLLTLSEGARHKLLSTGITGFALVMAACLEERQARERAAANRFRLERLLALSGMAIWFLGIALESAFNSGQPFNFLLLATSLSALAFCAAGKKLGFQTLYAAAWVPLPVSLICSMVPAFFDWSMIISYSHYLEGNIVKLLLSDLLSNNYLAGYGWLAWLCFAAAQGLFLYESGKNAENAPKGHGLALGVFTLEMLFVLASSCRSLLSPDANAPAWTDLPAVLPPLLYILVMAALTGKRLLPARQLAVLMGKVPVALFAFLAVWFGFGLFDAGSPYPLPFYLPVLNPLEIQQAFGIAMFAVWQASLRELADNREDENQSLKAMRDVAAAYRIAPSRLMLLLSLLLFAWLHSILFRSIHFFTGTPMNRVWDHDAFQTLLTVLWGLWGLAHIILGNKKRTRPLWVIGAILMVAVTAKVFMIDLADKGTLFRIVSFFVMGGLFLLVGWLAPLPPRPEESSTAQTASQEENHA